MTEPVRLICPDCQLVYRIKKLRLGKEYACRDCGGSLRSLEPIRLACPSCGGVAEEENLEVSTRPRCRSCADAPEMILATEYESSRAVSGGALSLRRNAAPGGGGAALHAAGDLARLPALIENLAASLEELKRSDPRVPEIGTDGESRLLETADSLSAGLRALGDKLKDDFSGLDAKVTALLEKLEAGALPDLSEQLREAGDKFMASLDEYREAQGRELAKALESGGPQQTVEMDIDDLAEKLMNGIRVRAPRLDEESGSAVDALARVADGLVREQSENTSRLERLAEEIRTATAGLEHLEDWRAALPARVADELGRTVEDRVVGPLSSALARQAPAILSDLQDNKLVDIVSRSVREAQRPLLREILSGGRNGVPAWLFATVLIPLILILGLLFLPGELGFGDTAAATSAIADSVGRIEQTVQPMRRDADARLAEIENAIVDIRDKALAHATNAATLAEEVRNLKRERESLTLLNEEYKKALETQTRRVRAYESRLSRLGVSPDSVQIGE